MSLENFAKRLSTLERQLKTLERSASRTDAGHLVQVTLQELGTALEELQVAHEELQQQVEETAAAEARTDAERRRYQELFELAPDGYLVTDGRGTIEGANAGAASLLGVPAALLPTKPLAVFIDPQDRGLFRSHLEQVIRGGQTTCEIRVKPRDMGSCWVSVTVNATGDAAGRPLVLRWHIRDITARRETEEALRRSEARYRQLVEMAPDVVYARDTEGRFTELNAAFEKITGWPRPEWLGRHFHDLLHPEDLPMAQQRYEALLRGEVTPPAELRIRSRSGTYLIGEFSGAPRYERGSLTGSIGVARDVTERRRTEQAWRLLADVGQLLANPLDSDDTLGRVAQIMSAGFADWCAIDVLEDGALRRAAVTAPTAEQADRRQALFRQYPAGPKHPAWRVARERETLFLPRVREDDLAQIAGDDRHLKILKDMRLVSIIMAPMHVHDQSTGVLTVGTGPSGRHYDARDVAVAEEVARRCASVMVDRRLYREAQAHRAALRAILDSMGEGVVSVDAELCIEEVNAHAAALLCVTAPDLIAQPLESVLSFADSTGQRSLNIASLARACIEQDSPHRIEEAWLELPNRRPVRDYGSAESSAGNGSATAGERRVMPVALTLTPRRMDAGSRVGAVLLFRDITGRREVDELRNNIISLVSHELRTPLTHIKGFATTMLQEDVAFDESQRLDFLRTIDQETDRLTRLVNDLLEMSRMTGGQLPMDIDMTTPAALVSAGLKRAEPYTRQHELSARLHDRLPLVAVDSGRVERVLVNLLENAAKYSLPGSRIEVCVHPASSAGQEEVAFSVTDHGVGVPEDCREAIFERFTRLQHPSIRQPPGTGLGLALCKAVVESHGGRIWMEPAPEGGSTFIFTIPAARES